MSGIAVRRRLLVVVAALVSLGPPPAIAAEPSPEFRANLRRTLELRKQRRRPVAALPQPAGAIVPYPFPPALIIRHRPEVHDEIDAFLEALRRSSG